MSPTGSSGGEESYYKEELGKSNYKWLRSGKRERRVNSVSRSSEGQLVFWCCLAAFRHGVRKEVIMASPPLFLGEVPEGEGLNRAPRPGAYSAMSTKIAPELGDRNWLQGTTLNKERRVILVAQGRGAGEEGNQTGRAGHETNWNDWFALAPLPKVNTPKYVFNSSI